MARVGAEEPAADLGSLLGSFLRPGMAAVLVGESIAGLAPKTAELVGPSGRVAAVDADGLDEALRKSVDLVLAGARASEHAALFDARRLLERRRPIVIVEFSPQALRASSTDPVSVLDRYRSIGLLARGAATELPAARAVLCATVYR